LKTQVKKRMQMELNRTIRSQQKQAVMDKLLELNKIDIPDSMVDQEIGQLQQRAAANYPGDKKPCCLWPRQSSNRR